jgi:hypothetical protein
MESVPFCFYHSKHCSLGRVGKSLVDTGCGVLVLMGLVGHEFAGMHNLCRGS